MNMDETTEHCAIRELEEETGLRLKPLTEVVRMGMTTMVCASDGVTSPGKGIGYGGVDDGTKDPASRRRRRDVWDDEEEEESF